MQAAETQIKSAIKSNKSAAVKSSLIDQEVIFPFFLKTYYRGHIWLQGAPQVSQTLGTRKFKRSPTYLNCDYTRYNKFSFHTNFVLLLCILDTGVRTLRKTYIWMLSLSFSILCVRQHAHIRNLFILLSNLTIRKSLYSIRTGTNYLACVTRMHGYLLRCLAQPQAMIS